MQNFGHFSREFKLFWQNKVLRLLFGSTVAWYGGGYVYSKGKVTDLPIIVVDEDRSEMSSKMQCSMTMKSLILPHYCTTKITFQNCHR
jgi:hypothetical protein